MTSVQPSPPATTVPPRPTGAAVAAAGGRRRPGRRPAVRWLLTPLALYAASRVVALGGFALAARLDPDVSFLGAVGGWDGVWYARVADLGYPEALVTNPDVRLAFFPLYPLLIDAVTVVTPLSALSAALAVNVVLGAAFAVVLWLLVCRLGGVALADRATAVVLLFPGSVVLSMAYAEPLMLTLAAACLLALVERRWVSAGVLAALTTATRPNGIAVCLACGWAALAAVRQHREWRALAAPLLSPLGFVGFFAFLWARTGDPLIWLEAQRLGWDERFDTGWSTLQRFVIVARDPVGDAQLSLITVGAVVVAVLAVLLWRWRPPAAVVAYTVGILVLTFTAYRLGARPRFILTAFPLLVALARPLRELGTWVVVTLGAAGMVMLAVMFTTGESLIP